MTSLRVSGRLVGSGIRLSDGNTPGRAGWAGRCFRPPGALAHPLLFTSQILDEPGDALSRLLIDRSRADDLGGSPDLGQCLFPGVEQVGRDMPGLATEPVRLAVEGGH